MPPYDQRRQDNGKAFQNPEIEGDRPTEDETHRGLGNFVKEKLSSHHRTKSEEVGSLPSDNEDVEDEHGNMKHSSTKSCSEDLGSLENPHVILSDPSSSSASDHSDHEDDRDSQIDSLHKFQHHSLGLVPSSDKSQYGRAETLLLADTQPNTQIANTAPNEYLPDSRVNEIETKSSAKGLNEGDLLPDTQVIWSVHRSFGDNSCSPSQINPIAPTNLSFSFDGDGLLPDTQANSQKLHGPFDDDSGSPAQANDSERDIAPETVRGDDDLPDTQVNVQNFSDHFTQSTFTSSAIPKTTITNHFLSTKSSRFDTPIPDTQVGASYKYDSLLDNFQTSTMSDADLPDTQINRANDPIQPGLAYNQALRDDDLLETQRYCPAKVLTLRDEDLPDTQMAFLQALDSRNLSPENHHIPSTQLNISTSSITRASDHISKITDNGLQATQPNTPSSSSPFQNTPISSQSFADDDFDDTQASIAPTLFHRQRTAASIASFKSDLSAAPSKAEKAPLNKLTCWERKRIACSYNCPPSLTKAMKQWIRKTHNLLDPFREDDDCWFHPAPPAARVTASGILRSVGKLQKCFTWQDHRGKHSLVLNYGIVSKIVNYKMTKQQKDGFINKQWHLSHLCGNWTCLNPAHTTVEPGNINISRNNCFSHRSGCHHEPKCMKDKKISLAPDGKPISHSTLYTRGEATQQAVDNWDDWSMQSFDDGEVSISLNDEDETDFALHEEVEDEDAPVEESGDA
ncbi:uncharacterized protein PAC_08471 [Phialocephala subalpina]|uniref:Zinc-binding loop region of homing endonuclease domain-containing protein n=1 Tax=Phialocephala subalpina TaxID=576137 RepID=A0A1L7X0P3_9HELO|nr:uncharacterized protein PAC_08471 [Phialocephala subalpina]